MGNELDQRILRSLRSPVRIHSKRPYRDAWTSAEALDYIRKRAGAEFDADAVNSFTAMMERWDERIALVEADA